MLVYIFSISLKKVGPKGLRFFVVFLVQLQKSKYSNYLHCPIATSVPMKTTFPNWVHVRGLPPSLYRCIVTIRASQPRNISARYLLIIYDSGARKNKVQQGKINILSIITTWKQFAITEIGRLVGA